MSVRRRNTTAIAPAPASARPGVPAIVTLLVLGLSACGGAGDDREACDAVRQVLTDVGTTSLQQISDPAAAERTYRDGAAVIRQRAAAAGGEVRAAADGVAAELDELGDGLARLTGEPSTTPQLPDIAGLTAAGQRLQQACS